MAKNEKKGGKIKYFFMTIFMTIVLILVLLGGTIFFDYLGIINVSKLVDKDSKLHTYPYIGKYLEFSHMAHLSEEDRIKETMNKYRDILMAKKAELDLKENQLVVKEKALLELEKSLNAKEGKLLDLEADLKLREEVVSTKAKAYTGNEKNVERFAKVYTKMDPVAVAGVISKDKSEIVAEIFEKMDERKIAPILDELSKTNPDKVREIVNLMTGKDKIDGN